MNADKIISIAKQYVGLKECEPNAKWTSKSIPECDILSAQLCESMESAGWQKGWPYCMAFVKAVYLEAFKDEPLKKQLIKNLLTPSVMTSYQFCKKQGYFSKTPIPGSIFIMQKAGGGTGHAGIVESIDGKILHTIEGNTSPSPTSAEADRNGDGIYSKTRKLDFTVTSGLHLIGFINLI